MEVIFFSITVPARVIMDSFTTLETKTSPAFPGMTLQASPPALSAEGGVRRQAWGHMFPLETAHEPKPEWNTSKV